MQLEHPSCHYLIAFQHCDISLVTENKQKLKNPASIDQLKILDSSSLPSYSLHPLFPPSLFSLRLIHSSHLQSILSHRLGSVVMSDQPFKNGNPKHQHFQYQPAPSLIHRLEFSITSTSRNVHVRGHSDTNDSDRKSKNRADSNNNNSKVTSSVRDENNKRTPGRRAGSAFLIQPTTNAASSAGQTKISHPRPTAQLPTLVRLGSSIEGSASSSQPPSLPPSSTSAMEPGTAPPEHRFTKAVEQTQTPPKPRTVHLPEEPIRHLENTTTAPKVSVPVLSAPSTPVLALHHQRSPPRISSDLSLGCSRSAAHCESVPALSPKPKESERTFAGHLTESVCHLPQKVSGCSGERRLQKFRWDLSVRY